MAYSGFYAHLFCIFHVLLYLCNDYFNNSVIVSQIIDEYEPISLEQMKDVRLMNRTDTKFVTTRAMLSRFLDMARAGYYAQEIDGKRVAAYNTVYFDTERCDMFLAHHNGRLDRQKVRVRSYVDSRQSFLEVKTKNNHGRTKKDRVAVDGFAVDAAGVGEVLGRGRGEMSHECGEFLSRHLRYAPITLKEQIENNFERMTLVNKAKTERLTIDTNLRFHNLQTGKDTDFGGLVVIELKRDGAVPSPVLNMLRCLRIKPMGFSKYCMGMAMTNDRLKRNLFIPRLRRIAKMANGNDQTN